MRAYSEVFCVHTPSRSRLLLLAEREIFFFTKKARLQMESELRSTDNSRDLARLQFPEAILSVNLSLLISPFCPTTLCLATHECAILAIDGPKMTNSTTLGLVTSLKMMMMVVGVLNFAVPQSTPPSENLAIQKILWHPDPVCCFASVPVRAIRDRNSDICCLCCLTMKFGCNSTDIVELVVNGLLADVGIGSVP